DAELRKVSTHEAARPKLHLADPRDRQRDRHVHLRLAAFGDADAQDASARRARADRTTGPEMSRVWRRRRRLRAVVDVTERAEQPVGLLAIDLAFRQQAQDLLP